MRMGRLVAALCERRCEWDVPKLGEDSSPATPGHRQSQSAATKEESHSRGGGMGVVVRVGAAAGGKGCVEDPLRLAKSRAITLLLCYRCGLGEVPGLEDRSAVFAF